MDCRQDSCLPEMVKREILIVGSNNRMRALRAVRQAEGTGGFWLAGYYAGKNTTRKLLKSKGKIQKSQK
jgi:hypothetical protein